MFKEKYGPWSLIVGGSEGVGASFARKLAGAGLNLFLVARKLDALEQVAQEIRAAAQVEVRILSVDLAKPEALDAVAAATAGLDIGLMIYNAGGGAQFGEFVELDVDVVLQPVRLNAIGQTLFTHHFGARMKNRGGGGMIIVGSNAAAAAVAGLTTYSAAKAYTQTLCEGLWYELKPHGVNVVALVLGATKTPALRRLGVPVDSPNFPGADPDDVAEEGLAHLEDGPIWIAASSVDHIDQFRGLSRAEAVTRASEFVARLNSGAPI
jgi:short-subunit dehydrogenase